MPTSLWRKVKTVPMSALLAATHAIIKSLCGTNMRRRSDLLSAMIGAETEFSKLFARSCINRFKHSDGTSPRQSLDKSSWQFELRMWMDEQIGDAILVRPMLERHLNCARKSVDTAYLRFCVKRFSYLVFGWRTCRPLSFATPKNLKTLLEPENVT